MVKRKSHLVEKKIENKKPKIIVKDIVLSENYYRVTQVKLDNKIDNRDKFYINWNTDSDFKRGFSQLQRHYKFNQQDIISVNTKTHRYSSSTFVAKGFKP